MEQHDRTPRRTVDDAWSALSHRVAAIAGSLTALVSLLWDVPVAMASLRGALAWLAISLLARLTSWLLSRTDEGAPVADPKPPETT